MHSQSGELISESVAVTGKATYQGLIPRQTLYTVEQFATAQPAFTPAALRNLIFRAASRHSTIGEIPGNGLIEYGAIVRVGRKVLIDENRFLEWVRSLSAGVKRPQKLRT